MAKKMTLQKRAAAYAATVGGALKPEHRDLVRRGVVLGYHAGHRANRLTRAERAVVKAAMMEFKKRIERDPHTLAITPLVSALKALARAKGGAR
jgi:hypothetical protein